MLQFSFLFFSNPQALAIIIEVGTQIKLELVFFFFFFSFYCICHLAIGPAIFLRILGEGREGLNISLVISYFPLFHMDSLKQNKVINVFRKSHWTFALEQQKSSLQIPSTPIFRKSSGTVLSFAVPNLYQVPGSLYPFFSFKSKGYSALFSTVLFIHWFGCLCLL